jgi:hypothetical protein
MNNKLENIFSKIRNNSVELSKYVNKQVYLGIKTGKNEAFIIDKETKEEIINNNKIEEKIILPIATGKEIYRYKYLNNEKYLLFTQYDIDIKNEYPSTFEWLKNFEEDLQKRGDKGKDWWNLRTCDYYDKIVLPKIIWRSISNECGFYLDSDGRLLLSNNNYFIASNSFTLLGILNSRLTFLFLSNVCTTLQGGFFDFRRDKVLQIPISQKTDLNDLGIGKTAELQQINNTLFQDLTQKFQRTLERKFALTELPKKLQDWYLLSYAEFIKELAKKKIKLSLNEEAEWETYFTTEAKKVLELKAQIAKTDKEIDQMVYALYELTEDEIKIVEGS